MASIPEYIIDQVRDRTDIVEVVSRYVSLKKAGRNYRALCPFHHEKTPSFMVSPAKQIYHCFGCGAGGNAFNFLMKYERLEFPEAVRELAQRAGIAIPVASGFNQEKSSLSEKLHSIAEMATHFYQKNLTVAEGDARSKRYMEGRGLTPQVIEKFKLGYAAKSWNGLLGYLKGKGFDEGILEKSGLLVRGRDGRLFDRFRNKIIFPISSIKGSVKGFGSRVMDDSLPKYMNSPETLIYNKGSHLYGLNLTWEDIRDKNAAVVVEGYLDLLSSFKHGVKNIVASLGTALTQEQIRLLKRYTNNVIILFDADQAGESATVRSLDLLIEEDMKIKVVQLPKGEDPDSFVNKYGADEFKKLLDNAQDVFDYKLNLLLTRHNRKELEGKARVASEMLPLISKIKNSILQSGYLKRLAEALAIDEADLRNELKKVRPDYTYKFQGAIRDSQVARSETAEKILAGLMLEDDLFIKCVKDNLTCEDFKDGSIKKIVEKIFQHCKLNKKTTPSKLMDSFGQEEKLCSTISELIATCENLVDRQKSLDDCIKWIKHRTLKERLNALCDEIRHAQESGDDSKVIALVTKYNEMIKEAEIKRKEKAFAK